MLILDYKSLDVLNGTGTRSSIWLAGCDHQCPGCFSKHTWAWKGQTEEEIDLRERVRRDMSDSRIKRDGISLLGGDPFYERNLDGLVSFLKWFRAEFPNKTVWLWTGFTREECLLESRKHVIVTSLIDVLVDGKFVSELKDIDLNFRGSSNQRIIHIERLNESSTNS
ncbi:anaerobic ribonucleotide reductase small subunit [Aeromonas phage PX29]|uniref:NrdG anaerobic NTP reductase small subunit n=1 Tax=Aeromonas phage PX29 TaxID=926067 RepID=E5DPW7_9CAUD|nr:anaerobic ribonucleotide reductase small subunit [Aeromonas phage PX29]ADQ52753.1 NrdG anaerobic NTP reductase small subunit [Aeromonas phage PX29]